MLYRRIKKYSLSGEQIFEREHTQMTFFLAAIITQLAKVFNILRTIVLTHPNKIRLVLTYIVSL